jgi:hypothetical protein
VPTLDLQATLVVLAVQQTQMAMQVAQATRAPTAIPTVVQRSYPCEATVNPNTQARVLNVVRQLPNPNAATVASVERGATIVLLEPSEGASGFFYIQYRGRAIGWLSEEYIVPSAACP